VIILTTTHKKVIPTTTIVNALRTLLGLNAVLNVWVWLSDVASYIILLMALYEEDDAGILVGWYS
jgi:hypothetical protein